MIKTNMGRIMTMGMLLIAACSLAVALVVALRWMRQPFPGIMVEQSLVIAGIKGESWGGAAYANLQRVIEINKTPVDSVSQYNKIILTMTGDNLLMIKTVQPDGNQAQHQIITMASLPWKDAARLFFLPWGIGLV